MSVFKKMLIPLFKAGRLYPPATYPRWCNHKGYETWNRSLWGRLSNLVYRKRYLKHPGSGWHEYRPRWAARLHAWILDRDMRWLPVCGKVYFPNGKSKESTDAKYCKNCRHKLSARGLCPACMVEFVRNQDVDTSTNPSERRKR